MPAHHSRIPNGGGAGRDEELKVGRNDRQRLLATGNDQAWITSRVGTGFRRRALVRGRQKTKSPTDLGFAGIAAAESVAAVIRPARVKECERFPCCLRLTGHSASNRQVSRLVKRFRAPEFSAKAEKSAVFGAPRWLSVGQMMANHEMFGGGFEDFPVAAKAVRNQKGIASFVILCIAVGVDQAAMAG